MLGVDPGRLAGIGLPLNDIVPPLVARRLHYDVRAGAFIDDDVFHFLAAAHRDRFVHRGLERDLLAAAELPVGGDDFGCSGIDDAFLQALRGKAAEDHRMGGADAGAGLHRGDHFDRHRHVDQNAVALLDAVRFQRVRELTDLVIELPVADLGDLAVVRLENDRGLVGLGLKVPVEAVIGSVQFAIVEPLEEWRIGFVEHLRKRLVPQHMLAREAPPEAGEVLFRLRAQLVVGVQARDICLLYELGAGRKQPRFVQHRFDGLGRHHAPPVIRVTNG